VSWTIMPSAVVLDSSCPNLTRASIEKKGFNPRGWIVGHERVYARLQRAMPSNDVDETYRGRTSLDNRGDKAHRHAITGRDAQQSRRW
jgi:hypothetical protein